MKPCQKVFIISLRRTDPVDEQIQLIRIIPLLSLLHHLLDPDNLPLGCKEPCISLFLELKHKFHLVITPAPTQIRKNIDRI